MGMCGQHVVGVIFFFCRSILCMRCTPLEYPSDAHDHFDSNRTASAHNLREQKERKKRERETECEKQRASQSPSTKSPMLKKLVSSRCLHIDANTCQGHCRKMHTTLMTKHGELNWLATPSMFQLLALGHIERRQRSKFQGFEQTRATSACRSV